MFFYMENLLFRQVAANIGVALPGEKSKTVNANIVDCSPSVTQISDSVSSLEGTLHDLVSKRF